MRLGGCRDIEAGCLDEVTLLVLQPLYEVSINASCLQSGFD